MGTPRASASVDQMRNVQKSASRRGECTMGCDVATQVAYAGAGCAVANSSRKTGAIITTDCCEVWVAAAGCAEFGCGSKQDFIVAQQSHCTIGAGMLMPQICAGPWDDIATNAIINTTPMANRLCTLKL